MYSQIDVKTMDLTHFKSETAKNAVSKQVSVLLKILYFSLFSPTNILKNKTVR